MSNPNGDVLYLIIKELQDDQKTLYSCLLVNKTWCDIIVPILWKNPWKHLKQKTKPLLNVIISHLSNETKENLRDQGIRLLQQEPLFNYISFCKHLDICMLEYIISINICIDKISILRYEILKLFINENTKFTHLYIPYQYQFDFQIHLIPGAKHCFSELEFLHCYTGINDINRINELAELCKSIKELELIYDYRTSNYNYEIVKLIEAPKKLFNVQIHYHEDQSFYNLLVNSLIKHADTIRYLKLSQDLDTKVLSSFVNLKRLELEDDYNMKWNCLKDLSLPFLQILRAKGVTVNMLAGLIECTSGYLIEINISCVYHKVVDNKRIIQAIYQKCPNLKYLKILLRNSNISELENLLINCQSLNSLYVIIRREMFYWDDLFKTLAKSSPTSLFKFKFWLRDNIFKLESLKLFFDNWKGRHPMLLQIIPSSPFITERLKTHFDLIEEYRAKGIIKKYDNDGHQFEWIKRKNNNYN